MSWIFWIQKGKFAGLRDSLFEVGECASNSRADCIHESYQGFELGVGAQENEENVINKTLPKIDQVEECLEYGVFLLAH